jgi:broad specificity phosphatase PhoE
MTRIVLVRHGQTEWNRFERVRGRADIALDATGRAQAEATGQRVAAELQPAAVYCSPLQRALHTAQAIASRLSQEPQIDQGLVDMDFGDWQGLTGPEVEQRWPEAAAAWIKAPDRVSFPGGESLPQVLERCSAALGTLIERHREQTIAAVAHTVVNRVLLCFVLGIDVSNYWRIGQDTCAINVFTWRDQAFYIQSLNDTGHLRSMRMV